MSHVSVIKSVEIRDTRAIYAAIKSLQDRGVKIQLSENTLVRGFSKNERGLESPADFCLQLAGSPHDVGIFRNAADPSLYEIRADFYGNHIARILGTKESPVGLFLQRYSVESIRLIAMDQGHMVEETVDDAGLPVLLVSNG